MEIDWSEEEDLSEENIINVQEFLKMICVLLYYIYTRHKSNTIRYNFFYQHNKNRNLETKILIGCGTS